MSEQTVAELRALLKTALEVTNEIGVGEGSRPSLPVAPDGPVAVIRENVAHIARGCRSGRSHNPAVYVQAIEAALAQVRAPE